MESVDWVRDQPSPVWVGIALPSGGLNRTRATALPLSLAINTGISGSWTWKLQPLHNWCPGSQAFSLNLKFRLKLKKVGKTTRPLRYDLNQISYSYTVEVRNKFKGLDLIECLMNYGWRFMTLYRRQGARSSPRKRNEKKQNGCLWKEEKPKAKDKRKRYTHLNAEFQRIARRDKKAFLSDQCQE